jgi:hypothetical protein
MLPVAPLPLVAQPVVPDATEPVLLLPVAPLPVAPQVNVLQPVEPPPASCVRCLRNRNGPRCWRSGLGQGLPETAKLGGLGCPQGGRSDDARLGMTLCLVSITINPINIPTRLLTRRCLVFPPPDIILWLGYGREKIGKANNFNSAYTAISDCEAPAF